MAAEPDDNRTATVPGDDEDDAAAGTRAVNALVITWSADRSASLGAVAFFPAFQDPCVLGRAGDGVSGERALFFRQRPGTLSDPEVLVERHLSRRQLIIKSLHFGLEIENVGKADLSVNGKKVKAATVTAGDVVTVCGCIQFLCTRRRMEMPRLEHLREPNLRPFGEPDADDMLGESPPIWALRDRLAFVARTNKHVLVLGQSGSGKELAARAIHRQSGARGALVALNAATLPPGLIDAELFGNLKNYPNAGQPERVGLVGEADGGTLFLDEIGELSEDVQAHLFRVLDRSGEYHRLGEAKTRRSRFRLVGATNRAMSRLRPELRARIPLQVDVPSLDARKEDIPLLVRHLLRRAAEETPSLRERILAVDGEGGAALLERLLRRTYTTNVRELEGLLWEEIQRGSGPARAERGAGTAGSEAVTPVDPAESAQRGEGADVPSKEVLVAALSDADGRVALAAEKLGVDRYRVYRWMRLYGMR